MQRYEFIGGTSRKFWMIQPPEEQGSGDWTVWVKFGRIGTAGQTHTKVFSYKSAANRYYDSKVDEKRRKGYKLKSEPKPILMAQATAYPTYSQQAYVDKYIKPACKHDTITRTGNTWKCKACGDKVEFEQPQVAVEQPAFQQKVRRFFDMRPQA